jgi:predicted secreted protein
MAEHQLQGQDYLLKIDPAGGTTYSTVVCLKSFDFNAENAEVDSSSFCESRILPGLTTTTLDFEGIQLFDPATLKVSGADLFDVLTAKDEIGWQMVPLVPESGDVTRSGKGYIFSLSENYSLNEPCTFTSSIKVAGAVTQTITA